MPPSDSLTTASDSRFEELISLGTAVIYACRPDGDFAATYISENVESQLGYTPGDFLKDPSFWADNIHPEDKNAVFDAVQTVFEHGRKVHQYRFRHKNDEYRWMRDELRRVTAEDGSPAEIIGSWIDITEIKELEERLTETQAHLAEAQRIAHLGSWSWNTISGAAVWSDEVYRIFRLSPEEITPTMSPFWPASTRMIAELSRQRLSSHSQSVSPTRWSTGSYIQTTRYVMSWSKQRFKSMMPVNQ